ncbi:hypothetical protein LC593_34050 [Nostoc sp. CHAB 5844]|nr:hypothetical protein [Nostoc sp. CHAB 5844]
MIRLKQAIAPQIIILSYRRSLYNIVQSSIRKLGTLAKSLALRVTTIALMESAIASLTILQAIAVKILRDSLIQM